MQKNIYSMLDQMNFIFHTPDKSWEQELYVEALALDHNKPGKHVAQWYMYNLFEKEIAHQPIFRAADRFKNQLPEIQKTVIHHANDDQQLILRTLQLPPEKIEKVVKCLFIPFSDPVTRKKAIHQFCSFPLDIACKSIAEAARYDKKTRYPRGSLGIDNWFFLLPNKEHCWQVRDLVRHNGYLHTYFVDSLDKYKCIQSLPVIIKKHELFKNLICYRKFQYKTDCSHERFSASTKEMLEVPALIGGGIAATVTFSKHENCKNSNFIAEGLYLIGLIPVLLYDYVWTTNDNSYKKEDLLRKKQQKLEQEFYYGKKLSSL